MYRKQIAKKTSLSLPTTPINKKTIPTPSYAPLSVTIQRAVANPETLREDEWLQLDSAIGTRATNEIKSGKRTSWVPEFKGISAQWMEETGQNIAPVQAKLTIGAVGDKYEREADRVAAEVVRKINHPTYVSNEQGEVVQGKENKEDVVKMQLKPKMPPRVDEGVKATPEMESAIKRARGGGKPLAPGLQKSMGQAMGADFSGVRVHTDAQSDQMNQSIQARAFTTGQDVFFRAGAYQPESRGGQELIAHELTHVVQQGRGIHRKQTRSNEDNMPRIREHAEVEIDEKTSAVEKTIQREPLAGVYPVSFATIRESDEGKSLVSGTEVRTLDSNECLTVDLGDVWQSRLDGGSLWYRVTDINGESIIKDWYVKEGTFEQSVLFEPPNGYITAYRFCDASDEKTMYSHMAKKFPPDKKDVEQLYKDGKYPTELLLKRAARHMDGSINMSPFVSLCTDEQSLLRYGHSGGLKDIMFGVDKPGVRAPHIAVFYVPIVTLITPKMVKEGVQGAQSLIGLARATAETEVVYYGDNLMKYLIRFKENPYRPEHYEHYSTL